MGLCVGALIRRSEDTFVVSGLFCFTGALGLNSGPQTCTRVLPAQPSHILNAHIRGHWGVGWTFIPGPVSL